MYFHASQKSTFRVDAIFSPIQFLRTRDECEYIKQKLTYTTYVLKMQTWERAAEQVELCDTGVQLPDVGRQRVEHVDIQKAFTLVHVALPDINYISAPFSFQFSQVLNEFNWQLPWKINLKSYFESRKNRWQGEKWPIKAYRRDAVQDENVLPDIALKVRSIISSCVRAGKLAGIGPE